MGRMAKKIPEREFAKLVKDVVKAVTAVASTKEAKKEWGRDAPAATANITIRMLTVYLVEHGYLQVAESKPRLTDAQAVINRERRRLGPL